MPKARFDPPIKMTRGSQTHPGPVRISFNTQTRKLVKYGRNRIQCAQSTMSQSLHPKSSYLDSRNGWLGFQTQPQACHSELAVCDCGRPYQTQAALPINR